VTVPAADIAVLDLDGLDALIQALRADGYETLGPVVRDGAIVPGTVQGVRELPAGYHDRQEAGRYRVEPSDSPELFGWAVGPGSWKAELFPPSQELWRATVRDGDVELVEPDLAGTRPLALIGARPCEVAALDVLDRVLAGGAVGDPRYERRRADAFVVVVECGAPAATCFCTSMGTGPHATESFDLALTEILDDRGHRFLARAGTTRGAELLETLAAARASDEDHGARLGVLEGARAAISRSLPAEEAPALLARNLEHPRWEEVAERCLACGNCTLVCPTCFCSDVSDTTDLSGEVRRTRTWASCFDLEHSHLAGGSVRTSTASRYRQWLTHKLSTWWDQFDTSGCVGCGRCIAWCPVGIDLTEEVAAIAATDATPFVPPRGADAP
jgi:ferredoxin